MCVGRKAAELGLQRRARIRTRDLRVMSERLGHESPAFTLKQSAHVIPGMHAAAAAMVAELVRDQATAGREAA
jgi:hypothetical protein